MEGVAKQKRKTHSVTKTDASTRTLKYCARIHREIATVEGDGRLTEAQRYEGVRMILGSDPALVAAKHIQLLMDPRSKLRDRYKVSAIELHRMIVDLHYMVTATPDYRSKRAEVSDSQFELDFAWHVEGGERVATLQEAAE